MNGPARAALGIECGYSCLGHNGRANATIGRALRLVMRNVGGSIPGAVSKSVFGQPGRVSLCFGEWEEKSPWEPFHVRRGFARADNVVTAHCATGTQDIADIWAETGEELLWVLAHSIDWIGNNKVLVPQQDGEVLLLLCPDFAHKIARDGLSIADAQRLLWEGTRTPIERWHRNHWRQLEERGYVEDGVVPLCAAPEQFLIAVAGGESGHHALYFCSFGLTWSVSKGFEVGVVIGRRRAVRAAANLDALARVENGAVCLGSHDHRPPPDSPWIKHALVAALRSLPNRASTVARGTTLALLLASSSAFAQLEVCDQPPDGPAVAAALRAIRAERRSLRRVTRAGRDAGDPRALCTGHYRTCTDRTSAPERL